MSAVPVHARWTPCRKAAAMRALALGRFTREELMTANKMTEEEMAQWEAGVAVGNHKVSKETENLRQRHRVRGL